jgi:hypothetical protein
VRLLARPALVEEREVRVEVLAEAIGEQADVTDGDLIYRGQSQWWITVENGVVTEIEEQYSP